MVAYHSSNTKVEHICVLGLGYVGLPLAMHLSKHFEVIGLDNNETRVLDLIVGCDTNKEYTRNEIREAKSNGLELTTDQTVINNSDFVIITVPTPITTGNKPDLTPLETASRIIGHNIDKNKRKKTIVFESTVYPGVTEEVCVPIIEETSGLKCGEDFFVGYSPERVNPGDKVNTIDTITKVVSGMNEDTLDLVDYVYSSFTKTHRASSIKVAEAAKVIENSQRDLNIAFVNELALIFHKLGIDTLDVLEAAGTKWNFLPFKPGLVGGHCISIDPYYLTYKAEDAGVMSQVIASGRKINDSMPSHVVNLISDGLNNAKKPVNGSDILILGATFKENCKDTRNSKIIDIANELERKGAHVMIYDPYYEGKEIPGYSGRKGIEKYLLTEVFADALLYAVDHEEFKEFIKHSGLGLYGIRKMLTKRDPVIVDIKGALGHDSDIKRL